MRVPFRACFIAALLAAACAAQAQHSAAVLSNPFSTPRDRAAGAQIYKQQCATCHGIDGAGSTTGPDLARGPLRRGSSDEALYETITKGVPGTAMTAFALNGSEVWQVITYLRSLRVGKAAEAVKGDAHNGARLFESNECIRCHTIGGKGGFIGPDLSEAGARLSLDELQRAILRPDEHVPSDYWSIRARTRNGKMITGMRLNEDTFSLQVRDSDGRLLSFRKNELSDYELIRTSPMPSFEGKLKAAELDDLISYLAAQRGPAEEPMKR